MSNKIDTAIYELGELGYHNLAQELLALTDIHMTPGQMARLGAAFVSAGQVLTDNAKAEARVSSDEPKYADSNCIFTYRKPYTSLRVNSKVLKETFGSDEYPELYTEVETGPSVAITLPVKY